jgi:HEAT repeat protein
MQPVTNDDLIAQLSAENWRDRRRAARWLGARRAVSAVPALVERLRDGRSYVQAAAALALGEIRDPETIPVLIEMFQGNTYGLMQEDGAPHRFMRILGSAGIALTRFNLPEAVEPLYNALRNSMATYGGDSVTAYMQASCVSHIGGERAYEMLYKLWTEPKFAELKVLVANSLGRCGVKRALPELVAALTGERATLRAAAAEGLGLLGDADAVNPLIERFQNAEAGLEPNTAPYLKLLVMVNIARSLGQLRTPPATTALKRALAQSERHFAAAVGLAYAKDSIARDILIPFAVSKDHLRAGMRTIAANALAALDDRRALPALQTYAQDRWVEDEPLVEDAIDRWQGLI